mgnify:CR=1 FL=1
MEENFNSRFLICITALVMILIWNISPLKTTLNESIYFDEDFNFWSVEDDDDDDDDEDDDDDDDDDDDEDCLLYTSPSPRD